MNQHQSEISNQNQQTHHTSVNQDTQQVSQQTKQLSVQKESQSERQQDQTSSGNLEGPQRYFKANPQLVSQIQIKDAIGKKLLADVQKQKSIIQGNKYSGQGSIFGNSKKNNKKQYGMSKLQINQSQQPLVNEESYSERMIDSPTGEVLTKELQELKSRFTNAMTKWRVITWTNVMDKLEDLEKETEKFSSDYKLIPAAFQSSEQYINLKQQIQDFSQLIQIIKDLKKPNIKDRHWDQVKELLQTDLEYKNKKFQLSHLLDSKIFNFRDEISDIANSADKQEKLEKQLNSDIIQYWEKATLEIETWQYNDAPCLISVQIGRIRQKLEDHQVILEQMMSMKYVQPFKKIVNEWLDKLQQISDLIQQLLKIQDLWMTIVKYYKLTKIGQQMPSENLIFRVHNQSWLNLMKQAHQNNVLSFCLNPTVQQHVPSLFEGLQKCRKSVDVFLESKMRNFPRFYQIPEEILFQLICIDCPLQKVQNQLIKMFTAINWVHFNQQQNNLIDQIGHQIHDEVEVLPLVEQVDTNDQVENWLCVLDDVMKKSVRDCCAKAIQDIEMPTEQFIDKYPTAITVLGLQILWTSALEKCLN